jgi:hypothetical protein
MGQFTVWLSRKLNGMAAASLTNIAGWTYDLNKPEIWPSPNSVETLIVPGNPRLRMSGRRRSAWR